MPSAPPNGVPRLPFSVIAIAVLQLLFALPILFICGITLWGAIWVTHEIRATPILAPVFGVPFCLGILSVIASVGLFRLKEWGRKASLCLVSLSTLACGLFLIFCHPQVQRGLQNVDDPFDIARPIAKVLLVIFIFVSICYWILLASYPTESPFRK